MSKKKSDIEKAIDKYDAEIAELQTKIAAKEEAKATLQGIVDEKAVARAKALKAKTPKAPKAPKATKDAKPAKAPTEAEVDAFAAVQ